MEIDFVKNQDQRDRFELYMYLTGLKQSKNSKIPNLLKTKATKTVGEKRGGQQASFFSRPQFFEKAAAYMTAEAFEHVLAKFEGFSTEKFINRNRTNLCDLTAKYRLKNQLKPTTHLANSKNSENCLIWPEADSYHPEAKSATRTSSKGPTFSLYNAYFNALVSDLGPNSSVLKFYLTSPTAFREVDCLGNTQLHHYFRYGRAFEDRKLKKQFLTAGNLFSVNLDGKFAEDCQGVNTNISDQEAINLQRLRGLSTMSKNDGGWFIYP